MNSTRQKPTGQRVAALAVSLLLLAAAARAGPSFVASSQVREGSVYSEVSLQLRCNVLYAGHDPLGKSDVLRIRLELTTVCAGAPPTVALSREQHRPVSADAARLDSIEYDGQSPGGESLRFNFLEDVRFDVVQDSRPNWITVRVFVDAPESTPVATTEAAESSSRMVRQPVAPPPRYIINLESWQRPPAAADMPVVAIRDDKSVFVSEVLIDGEPWYRVRVGYFDSADEAARELGKLRQQYPGAWIARTEAGSDAPPAVATADPLPVGAATTAAATSPVSTESDDKIAALMVDARRAMTAGELSRAVQIYTKVLQQPATPYHPEAQEFLALARERNGQIAHAKAEYQRYLDVYPDSEGTDRVRQRLAALLATAATTATAANPGAVATAATTSRRATPRASNWSVRTFLSQHYRRDVNQVNDQDEIVNQSSIYSDFSVDARRRGERFDFSARVTAGHRTDLLGDDERRSSGNDFRLSYAYADLADARTGLRGRLGRQTRNTGGVLGRFDGLNLTYAMNERLRFEAVAGQPVFSTADSPEDSRTFYGVSSTFAPFDENLDLGVFLLQQDIEGLTDRQAVGAELRYFGAEQSLWGIVDYDTEFAELGSVFLQGSWRLPANFTVTGLVDRRRSPFLNLGNALVGQQLQSFEDLRVLFTEEEIRQFALDRSPEVTTYSAGMSRPFTPKLQLNLNASLSTVDATPESGGVAATEKSDYSYYSADIVASSIFTEGDVGIVGLRYAVSDTTDVYSINIDTRFPIGRSWRINPRLRVDYREINSDQSTQWIYMPGLRLQYRMGRRIRLEFEAGKQFSVRDMGDSDLDRESYFVNAGYQFFY